MQATVEEKSCPDKIECIVEDIFCNLHEHYNYLQISNYLLKLSKVTSFTWLGLGEGDLKLI